jgi:hypothetical protein
LIEHVFERTKVARIRLRQGANRSEVVHLARICNEV